MKKTIRINLKNKQIKIEREKETRPFRQTLKKRLAKR
jgi:hypothetical protein